MPASLLDSQLAALEEPGDAITVGIDAPPDAIVANICRALAPTS
jgi:gluconate kinase